jgi:hypothetical protein
VKCSEHNRCHAPLGSSRRRAPRYLSDQTRVTYGLVYISPSRAHFESFEDSSYFNTTQCTHPLAPTYNPSQQVYTRAKYMTSRAQSQLRPEDKQHQTFNINIRRPCRAATSRPPCSFLLKPPGMHCCIIHPAR